MLETNVTRSHQPKAGLVLPASFPSLFYISKPSFRRAWICLEARWLPLLGLPCRDAPMMCPCHSHLHKLTSSSIAGLPTHLKLDLSPNSILPTPHPSNIHSTLKGHLFSRVQRSVFDLSQLGPSHGVSARHPAICVSLLLDRHNPVPDSQLGEQISLVQVTNCPTSRLASLLLPKAYFPQTLPKIFFF